MVKCFLKGLLLTALWCLATPRAHGQRYLADLDSSLFIRDTIRPFIKRFDNVHVSGYIQPQFQVAQAEGIKTFAGGDFSPYSRSRFMLRRARIKIDYFVTNKDRFAKELFTFQVDATERGVAVRDMFARLYENRFHNFAFTAGLFARPFGYEVNLSSAYRETPERGRMSQTLMPAERDLGAMVTFEPQQLSNKLHWLRWDAGFFNGQGLSGTTDFDSHKDFISRMTLKPVRTGKIELSGGLSLLVGGWRQANRFVYTSATAANGDKIFAVDSSLSNIGKLAPRHYYGADVQVKWLHDWGETEWRAEYWTGQQPGTFATSVNPGTIPTSPTFIRRFDGAFFYFLQHLFDRRHQLLVKFDWYDPNTAVKRKDIGRPGTNLGAADIRFSTTGIGYIYYMSDFAKVVLYYEIVSNEKTGLTEYSSDSRDNVFTCRLQFRF